jgi:hypothetical protein
MVAPFLLGAKDEAKSAFGDTKVTSSIGKSFLDLDESNFLILGDELP